MYMYVYFLNHKSITFHNNMYKYKYYFIITGTTNVIQADPHQVVECIKTIIAIITIILVVHCLQRYL